MPWCSWLYIYKHALHTVNHTPNHRAWSMRHWVMQVPKAYAYVQVLVRKRAGTCMQLLRLHTLRWPYMSFVGHSFVGHSSMGLLSPAPPCWESIGASSNAVSNPGTRQRMPSKHACKTQIQPWSPAIQINTTLGCHYSQGCILCSRVVEYTPNPQIGISKEMGLT